MKARVEHLEERAELYALGMLADEEFAAVDAHVRDCDACAQRLGRAAATLTAMVDATHARAAAPSTMLARMPSAARMAGALRAGTSSGWRSATAWTRAAAAVFALAASSLAVQNAGLRADIAVDSSAFSNLVHSHFLHAPFLTAGAAPINAKVVYDRHGGWYEILATGIDAGTRVSAVRGAAVTSVQARFVRRGDVLSMALPSLGRVDELQLIDAQGRVIARVRPALGGTTR